ncbi:MAG TPA: hypothetical protein VFR99_11785 [Marmoricola sp.]|nr:hypothetical protein [Marmoricola sp.]
MTSFLDKDVSAGDRARSRAYAREFIPGLLGYAVVLVLVVAFGGLDGTSPWRFVWAALPAVPAVWMVWAVWRYVQRADEYQRVLLLGKLALSFGVMVVTSVTLGLLVAAGLPAGSTPWIIYASGMITWVVSALFVRDTRSC